MWYWSVLSIKDKAYYILDVIPSRLVCTSERIVSIAEIRAPMSAAVRCGATPLAAVVIVVKFIYSVLMWL